MSRLRDRAPASSSAYRPEIGGRVRYFFLAKAGEKLRSIGGTITKVFPQPDDPTSPWCVSLELDLTDDQMVEFGVGRTQLHAPMAHGPISSGTWTPQPAN